MESLEEPTLADDMVGIAWPAGIQHALLDAYVEAHLRRTLNGRIYRAFDNFATRWRLAGCARLCRTDNSAAYEQQYLSRRHAWQDVGEAGSPSAHESISRREIRGDGSVHVVVGGGVARNRRSRS